MIKKTRFHYIVAQGERITITTLPVKVGPRVTAAENGNVLPPTLTTTTPRFSFTATQLPKNSHFVVVDFDFYDDDVADSYFQIAISGSQGGHFDDVLRVKKTNKVHRPVFRFEVA